MNNSKFNTRFLRWGIDIHIHSNSQQLFDMAVDYFHNSGNSSRGAKDKRIDFYFEKRNVLARGRWNLTDWKKGAYMLGSWSRDINMGLDYSKGIIRSLLSSQCKFSREEIEDLLIFQPLRIMLTKFNLFIIHAGCVVKEGKGLLIPSPYGKGKTIITLYLVRSGFKFLGDEYILLERSNDKVKAHLFPQRIGIKKRLINLFPELEFLQNREDSPHKKKRFWIDEVYPNAAVNVCYPQLIISPYFKNESRLCLTKDSKRKALLNILQDKESSGINRGLVFKDAQLKQFNILSSLVKQTDIYRLSYSDNSLCDLSELIEKSGLISSIKRRSQIEMRHGLG